MELSTVPIGVAAEAHRYLAEGGPANLAPAARVPLRHGAAHRRGLRAAGRRSRRGAVRRRGRATDGRRDLPADRRPLLPGPRGQRERRLRARPGRRDRRDRRGGRRADLRRRRCAPRPTTCTTRSARSTRWSSPCSPPAAARPATASAGGDDEAWDVERMAALDIPVLQGLCLTSSREEWEASDDGVTPLDSATQIAIPEFDGRIITAPFSFKEIDADGLPRYVADPERCARVAGIAVNHARLRHVPHAEQQDRADAVGLPDQALPDRQRRRPRHPGLRDPAAAPAARRGLRPRRADGDDPGSSTLDDDTEAGDALIHALIAAGGQDEEWLTDAQLDRRARADHRRRLPALDRATCPPTCGRRWSRPGARRPGTLFVNDAGEIVLATLRAGNVVLLIQPPRGFGENPVAIYHDPDLRAVATTTWRLPLARSDGLRRARRRPPRQARLAGVAARQERRAVGVLRAPTPRSATCR